MGNEEEKIRLANEHCEEMERLRNIRDVNMKKLEVERLAIEYGLEKHKAEIQRLANLDKYHYDAELKRIEAMVKKNNQLHEREKIKINNDFINNQKSLSNDELRINKKFEKRK